MKKSIILKSFLVILISMMLVFTASTVRAATDDEYQSLFGDESNTGNTNSSNTNGTNTNNTNTNNARNSNNTNRNNNNTNRNNTNTSLPKTGIEDSLPTVVLVVVFGVSAVYAYKKIKDYRNID